MASVEQIPLIEDEETAYSQSFRERLLATMKFFVEFAPLVVVIWLGVLLGLQLQDLYMHAIAAMSTVALVHCIGALRETDAIIHECGQYKNITHEYGDNLLYHCYDRLLHQRRRERAVFTIYTTCTILFWIGNASCYVAYLAEHLLKRPAVALDLDTLKICASALATCTIVLAVLKVWARTRITKELNPAWFVKQLNRSNDLNLGEESWERNS